MGEGSSPFDDTKIEYATVLKQVDKLVLEANARNGVRVRISPVAPIMNLKVKHSKELLESLVKDSISIAEVIRKLGLKQSGGNHSHIKRRIVKFDIDTSHFLGGRANSGSLHKGGPDKLLSDQILVSNRLNGRREAVHRLKRALIESGIAEQCLLCGLSSEWNGKKLVLQIDHIDGDFLNNNKENLRFLCPNCHSQTENFGRKNAIR